MVFLKNSKLLKHKVSWIFLIIFLLNFSLYNLILQDEEECPRDKPILKSGECKLVYCTPEEFAQQKCIIANYYIQTQWLNNLHIFYEKYMSHISVSMSPKGELFLSSHKVNDDFDKYLFGFSSEGEGLFYNNETNSYTSFEIIDFPAREYADYNNYVEIEGKGYLISVPTDDDIFLIDYVNKTSKYYSIRPYSKSSDTIFKINGYNDMFFTSYIFCKDSYNHDCYYHLQTFKLNLTTIEKINNITDISTVMGTRINCFQNKNGSIFCIYSKNDGGTYENPKLKHLISLIKPQTFKFIHTITIEQEFLVTPIFDETIQLREDLFVMVYTLDEQVLKVQLKNIVVGDDILSYTNFIKDIPEILINEDNKLKFKGGTYKRNDLYKINDNKFAILIKDFSKDTSTSKNSILQIYIFNIFNNDQNINIRRYSIDFELYNKHIYDDIRGYTLGNYFGVILGLTLDRDTSNDIATFMTFGFVNTTEQEKYDMKLKYNDSDSKIILSEYINEIENNVFGYELIGVKILSLPSEEDAGYFINNITNKKVAKDDIVDRDSELRFILSDKYKSEIYSIVFVGVVSEPSYERMNNFSEELLEYPLNSNVSEQDSYEPKIFYGKKLNFKFRLSECFDSCATCTELSKDEDNQKCMKCRTGFYFKEGTNNCYDKIDTKYYFDEETHMFSPCYQDCLTCSKKAKNSKQMNCLTCDYNLKFYNRSNNCLNCSKYVNYDQNECIDTIPDGYYLEDEELGSLGKCYYLCKTCTAGFYYKNNYLHMNCKTCLYKNKNFKPMFENDCPDTPDEEGDDTPIDGKCSFNKPILKDAKCQLIYCTPEEYEDHTCTVYNPTTKMQWLSKFNIFSEESTSSVCLANDIVSNEKVIFLAQNQEVGYSDKYLIGFYNNGTGMFYDEKNNNFNSFKKITFPVSQNLIEKVAYIEMDSKGYLLTTPIKDNLNLIDYNNDEKKDIKIDLSAYSTDKIILRRKETDIDNGEYLTDFIYCKNNDLNNCYLMMKNFEEKDGQLNEINSLISSVKVHNNTNLNCIKDENNYLKCIYNKVNEDSTISHVLGIFSCFSNRNQELIKEFELEKNYDINPSFDSMLEWNNDIYFIAYSQSDNKNAIKILFQKVYEDLGVVKMEDYIPSIPSIVINEDSLYNIAMGEAKKNSLYKMTNDRFAMLVNTFRENENTGIVIYIFTLYDSESKINVRHYPIYFTLYNTLVSGKLIGYNLKGFFGILMELNAPGRTDIKRASFFTFSFMNTTKEVSYMEGYDILFNKKEKIIVNDYFTDIENNLFGYVYENIRIISVPDGNKVGYFVLSQSTRLYNNDLISIDSKVGFDSSKDPEKGNYSFIFAPILKEPYYKVMNSYCQKLESYPLDQNDTESQFYNPKSFLGKAFSFNFYMEGREPCYENCQTCDEPSKDENNQKCIDCMRNYYKIIDTNNCFSIPKEGYYLDKNTSLLMPCYENCLTCDIGGKSTEMNCLTCKNNFKFYKKTKNCLNCKKYVNYEQTGCIDEIPEGYYLEDSNLGIIGKCHELCKTCEKGPKNISDVEYMNCKECKFTNVDFITEIEGNCPDTQKDDEKKEEEEEEEEGGDRKKDDSNSSTFIWIFIPIIIIVILVAAIFIRKYIIMRKEGNTKGDYSKMGQNISMEETPSLGIE